MSEGLISFNGVTGCVCFNLSVCVFSALWLWEQRRGFNQSEHIPLVEFDPGPVGAHMAQEVGAHTHTHTHPCVHTESQKHKYASTHKVKKIKRQPKHVFMTSCVLMIRFAHILLSTNASLLITHNMHTYVHKDTHKGNTNN